MQEHVFVPSAAMIDEFLREGMNRLSGSIINRWGLNQSRFGTEGTESEHTHDIDSFLMASTPRYKR